MERKTLIIKDTKVKQHFEMFLEWAGERVEIIEHHTREWTVNALGATHNRSGIFIPKETLERKDLVNLLLELIMDNSIEEIKQHTKK